MEVLSNVVVASPDVRAIMAPRIDLQKDLSYFHAISHPQKSEHVITKRISTDQILANLKAKVDQRIPIMISSAGNGLVAKLLEKCGADCVNTFSGARLRANGMGTMAMMWPILDSNRQTLDYTREDIMPAMEGKAFVCACLNANDPLKDMRMVLQECKDMGVQSVSNIGPSISYVDHDSEIYKVLTSAGITLQNEIDMLKLAREEMDMVTIGLGFTLEDSIAVCEQARPHIFCYHAGTTKGGLKGYDSGLSIEQTAQPMLSTCWTTRRAMDSGPGPRPSVCPSSGRSLRPHPNLPVCVSPNNCCAKYEDHSDHSHTRHKSR